MPPRKKPQSNSSNDSRSKLLQEANAFVQLIEEETGQKIESDKPLKRSDYPPPTPPEKNKSNPDGIVDVVTFCEHPYFLNLKLTPWQKIILKLFYSGTEGNTHLKIDDTRTETCEGCVWSSNSKAEEEFVKALNNPALLNKPQPYMTLENSPCMKCMRLCKEVKDARFEYEKEQALTKVIVEEIEKLQQREIVDEYSTEEDIFNQDLSERVRDQISRKVGRKFQELILVLGRRSGKSFMVGIIALYEVYKLLMMGHPQERYPLLEFDTITILNVAKSEAQAKNAIFDKIRNLAKTSPYFSQYIGKETTLELYFLTDYDKEENKTRLTKGQDPLIGTIQLTSGHSNSSTLVGLTVAVIIIDEMAAMVGKSDDEGGTDSDLYSMLKPSIATFGQDGKIICISNPLGPTGKFYELYESSFNPDDRTTLMFQLPTWLSNPHISKSFLSGERAKDPDNFGMHYGAEFGSSGVSPFLPKEAVWAAFDRGMGQKRIDRGVPHQHYFAHLDPAKSSDNYSLVVCHIEPIMGHKTLDGKPLNKVVVDHIHVWRPKGKNFPVNSEDVDKYIMDMATKFKFAQITYDQAFSHASITKLKQYGLNVVLTSFTSQYQNLIFTEMYDLFTSGRIDIYDTDTKLLDNEGNMVDLQDATEARQQLLMLQKMWKTNNTFKIEALKGYNDDIPDCIASAAYQALKWKSYDKLPGTRSAFTGHWLR